MPCHASNLPSPEGPSLLLCWAHQPPRGSPPALLDRAGGSALWAQSPCPHTLPHLYTHVLLAFHPSAPSAPMPAAAQGPWGHFISLCILPQGGGDAWMTEVHGLSPPHHSVCRRRGLWSCPCAGSCIGRHRRLEASPLLGLSREPGFFVPSPRNQGGEESRGPSSSSHSGEDAPGAMGCQACHHDNSCCWKPEVGGVEQPLPHADAAWERRGLLGCLPTHPALSLDLPLYKGGTIRQALTERETRRRTRGTGRREITINAHPHSCSLGRRARVGRGGNGTPPNSSSRGGGWGGRRLPSRGPSAVGQ